MSWHTTNYTSIGGVDYSTRLKQIHHAYDARFILHHSLNWSEFSEHYHCVLLVHIHGIVENWRGSTSIIMLSQECTLEPVLLGLQNTKGLYNLSTNIYNYWENVPFWQRPCCHRKLLRKIIVSVKVTLCQLLFLPSQLLWTLSPEGTVSFNIPRNTKNDSYFFDKVFEWEDFLTGTRKYNVFTLCCTQICKRLKVSRSVDKQQPWWSIQYMIVHTVEKSWIHSSID